MGVGLSTHTDLAKARGGVHRQHRSVLRLLCNSGPVPDMPTFPLRIPRVWPLEHPFGRYRHHVSVTQSHATQVQANEAMGGPHRRGTVPILIRSAPWRFHTYPNKQPAFRPGGCPLQCQLVFWGSSFELTYKTKLGRGQWRPLVGRASGPCCAKLAAPQALLL